MRTLIFALILLAGNLFAQPTPREWINQFTTNRPPQPVFGDNNVSISNRIAGAGGGTSWNFYGISPNTVARLTDGTNIAQTIVNNTSNAIIVTVAARDIVTSNGLISFVPNRIGLSNANYVLINNGGSSNQTATNFILLNGRLSDQNGLSLFQEVGSDLWFGDDAFANLYVGSDQTNGGKLNVTGALTSYGNLIIGGSALYFRQIGDLTEPTVPYPMVRLIPGDELKLGVDDNSTGSETTDVHIYAQLHDLHWTGYALITDQVGVGLGNSTYPWQVFSVYLTNGVFFNNGGVFTNWGAFYQRGVTASRLAGYDAGGQLTNSAYSDADIANALAGLSSTNIYVKTNGGIGYFNQFYSSTNTTQASNQTVLTVRGLAGQAAPLIAASSNGVTDVFQVDRSGNVVISNSSPSITFSNNAHKFALNTADGFALDFVQDGTIKASVNNSGNFNASSLTIVGSTLSDGSRNVKVVSLTNSGSSMLVGPMTNQSTIYAPTNTAPFFTTNFSTLLVTNLALPQRALLFVQLAFDDVTGGIPSCTVVATNKVSTNNFGSISPTLSGLTLVGTVTITNHYTYPLDTNAVIKFTDTSTGGAAVRMIQSILFAQ